MRFKPLVAVSVAIAGFSALAAAPAAQAGWITGQGSLPVFRSDAVCTTGMDFQYATYVPSAQARLLDVASARYLAEPDVPTLASPPVERSILRPPPPTAIGGLGVWVVDSDGTIDLGDPVVEPQDYTVPFNPLFIDLRPGHETIGGAVGSWPGTIGQLTHSTQLTLAFNRWLPPGTWVQVAWGNWTPGTPSSTAWRFRVSGCKRLVPLAPVGP